MFACAFCPFCSFTIFHPSCCHHLLSSPSIHQQPMLSKTIRLVFFLLLILYKRASVLLHVFLLHSPLSVPLFSTPSWWQRVRAVRPDCYSNFLMVRVAGLWWCFTSVWCLCVCVCSCLLRGYFCVLLHELSQGYLRCWRAFAPCVCVSLFQPASGRVYLPWWRSLLLLFSSSFYHWTLSLERRMEELAYISTCSRSHSLLIYP